MRPVLVKTAVHDALQNPPREVLVNDEEKMVLRAKAKGLGILLTPAWKLVRQEFDYADGPAFKTVPPRGIPRGPRLAQIPLPSIEMRVYDEGAPRVELTRSRVKSPGQTPFSISEIPTIPFNGRRLLD